MAYLTQPDYVKYVCSCGELKPITSLYFCRHCLKIRCSFCVLHEVDSHYCTNCLENMPSTEAKIKKNRCSSCFDCPSCFHTLSTRATLVHTRQSADPEASGDSKVENKQAKKSYYLSCFNCRWTSRDVGIPDQPVASGGWPERINPYTTRFNQLMEYYKAIALQEKQEKLHKEWKKYPIRGKYITLTDKTGVTAAMARGIAGLPSTEASQTGITNITPSDDEEEDELPADYYTKEVNLKQITSMAQRLAAPDVQPVYVSRLYPIPKLLTVKRSHRCRACDHNLTKPEYNPGSIKFKIELLAYYHVPEVKIISFETVKPGQKSALLIKLTNPTGHEMQVRLLEPDALPPAEEVTEEPKSIERSLEKSLNLEKETPFKIYREPDLTASSCLNVPDINLSLSQRDDAAEYDDDATAHPPSDIILWRKSNKLALRLELNTDEAAAIGSPARVAFTLEYSYRNTVPSGAVVQHRDHTLYATVLLNLGVVGQ